MRFLTHFLAAAGLALATGVSAQTAEQIRQFQQMSPEQREQLRKALDSKSGGVAAPAQPLSQPETVVPAPARAEGSSTIEQRYTARTSAAHLRQPQAERALTQQLRQFGYDLFSGTPTTFAPVTDIPVPTEYVVGPGDIIEVQLFGKENEQYSLVVSRDGRINFPEIGAISVAGMRFTDLRSDLEKRVAEQMIGVKASITMGALRSIRVFVLGEVTRSGSYTVSSLSTMTNALFVSGGVKPIGSLRNIQLKRNGKIITRLDLYDLLLRGDTSEDRRLQPGDVIFVPPIGQTAGIAGEVRRPAIYELRGENTVRQLIEIAGGLLPTAVPEISQLERIDPKGNITLLDLDLRLSPRERGEAAAQSAADEGPGASAKLNDGDVLRIYAGLDRMEDVVLLAGHVRRPGGTAWTGRMRIADLIPGPEYLLPQADLDYVVIRREEKPLGKIRVFSTRLSQAWADRESDLNVILEARDQVFVFPLPAQRGEGQGEGLPARREGLPLPLPASRGEGRGEGRQALLNPLLNELASQATTGEPTRIVSIAGSVRAPGEYPLEPGMTLADLMRAGGGLTESAYALEAEVTRYEVANGQKRQISHLSVELGEAGAAANLALQAHDKLTIKRLPEWSEQLTAEVRGEVRFPGVYPIKRGERLSELLVRAGGLTEQAFAEGTVFTREELRIKEQERLDTLARQLESDIAAASLEKAQEEAKQAEALATARSLLPQLKDARATGRLVIDLPRLTKEGAGSDYDVVLKGGDRLIVPQKTQEVTVIGEVQYPTSHVLADGVSVKGYVDRSGGFTYKADDGRAYVVRANGLVEPAYEGWWIFRSQVNVRAGDTIVVPLDVERMRPLTLWTNVTQIMYQLAVTLAALNTVGAI